jgi:hypothetical protein
MIKIKHFNERKNLGTLYHFTNIKALEKMIKGDMLEMKSDRGYISFSRDWSLAGRAVYFEEQNLDVRIAVDGTLLSDVYKIKPFLDMENLPDYARRDPDLYEAEEMIPRERIIFPATFIKHTQFLGSNYSTEELLTTKEIGRFVTNNNIPIYVRSSKWLNPVEVKRLLYKDKILTV